MKEITYHVHGMHCDGCVESVRKAVSALDGVAEVDVELAHGRVGVRFDEGRTDFLALKQRIESAGFEVG